MVNLTHVGIVGAGQMGSGIAQVCAAAGLDVSLVDVSDAALDRGMAAIAAGLERQVKKGTLGADAKAAMLSRIRTGTDHRSLEGADIVDLIGLDTVLVIRQAFAGEFGDPKYRPARPWPSTTTSSDRTGGGAEHQWDRTRND